MTDDEQKIFTTKQADTATGLRIILTDTLMHNIRRVGEADAKEKFEVTVTVDGERKIFTLDDFLDRLGFART